jgi:regulator of replication initiation timing
MRHRGATGQMEDRGERRVEMENQLDEIRQQIEEMRAMIESLIAEPAEPKE